MESREKEMEERRKEGKEGNKGIWRAEQCSNPSENFSKKWHVIYIHLNTNLY